MTQEELEAAGTNVPAHDLNGPQIANSMDFMKKYSEERDKRINPKGTQQYIELVKSEKFIKYIEDPWVKTGTPINVPVPQNGKSKFVIVGAGFGGILFAINLIKAGFKASDMVIIDPAGSFGGTWYWNRYPGLMCDVESYIYLPLIEEMNYMPKHRYASGAEIREYCESLCTKYGLHERAMFQSAAQSLSWDGESHEWIVEVSKKPKGGQQSSHTFRADFVMIAPGVLANAHIPDVEGLERFDGHMFHTARWDYEYTGGSPEKPSLTGLTGKKVALIGTGPTSVQAVPQLAKYAEHLTVWQRTPSSVDVRGNHETDPGWFSSNVATKPGWSRERNLNFLDHVHGGAGKPDKNLVNDAWTRIDAYQALVGGPKTVTMDNVEQHVGELYASDYPRQERIRRRTKDIVQDPETAVSLQAHYPTWCKRPCFHDEYLQAFNLPNVELLDTKGRSFERLTEKGIELDEVVHDYDVIIWGTGFRSPIIGSSAAKANLTVTGRDGISMEDLNSTLDLQTLHGMSLGKFSNLFVPGPVQASATANFTFVLDVLTAHIAYIVSQATKQVGQGNRPVIEPTQSALDDWGMQIMQGAVSFAGLRGCTPGYVNGEGEVDRELPPEFQMKAAKQALWSEGFVSFDKLLQDWRATGRMEGLEVTGVV